jgi:hypothetical protein
MGDFLNLKIPTDSAQFSASNGFFNCKNPFFNGQLGANQNSWKARRTVTQHL